MKVRNTLILSLSMLAAAGASAAEPSGYYDACHGKGGEALLTALHQKIGSHTTVSYNGLWNVYETSDVRPDGTVWDMYSTKNWGKPSQAKHCGNYSSVGDCINREHSMPKSWFNDASPMYSDAFHLYPTDGKVNGQRSNFPYGECANGTTLPSNGNVKALGKLGTSTFAGYSGRVFEPDDEYKGDFARSYFYMATAYNDRVANWNSDMLAGNDYPVFSSWALNLLLKWHRQDPVSDKERTRNDAVYAHQRNRNPYIDHPELVEYVWGDKKTMTWNGEDETAGTFTLPVDGSTIDMGTAGTGVPVSKTITVKGQELTGAVTLSATNALQISPATLTAAQANAGAQVTLTWKFSRAGSYSSTLTITSGSAKTTATVRAKVQDGLPAMDATEISAESFTARWTYVGGDTDGKYTLDVRQGGTSIDGYPRAVPAEAGSYTVDGLEPGTTYTYTVSSATLTSNTVTVTTGQLLPCIEFLYDGVLAFYSEPGTPSDPEEILVDIENITSDIAVSVTAPFEISSDRTAWGTSLTLKAAEDRIYMRLNAAAAGEYTTVIKATAGDYTAESGRVSGTCADAAAEFVETFEANFAKTYTTGEYQGSAAKWYISNVGVVGLESQGDRIYAGEKACRFGKEADSYIEMLDGKTGGAGTVSFYACRWRNNQGNDDPEAAMDVEVSTDGGETWTKAGSVTIAATTYTQYSVPVNVGGTVRVRLQQTEGQRLHLDNVAISNYKDSGLNDPTDEYYSWDAYSPAAGTLRIESAADARADVHGVGGITYVSGARISGEATFELPAGLYVVVIGGQSRRVLVK